jgi:hypothetical protein
MAETRLGLSATPRAPYSSFAGKSAGATTSPLSFNRGVRGTQNGIARGIYK